MKYISEYFTKLCDTLPTIWLYNKININCDTLKSNNCKSNERSLKCLPLFWSRYKKTRPLGLQNEECFNNYFYLNLVFLCSVPAWRFFCVEYIFLSEIKYFIGAACLPFSGASAFLFTDGTFSEWFAGIMCPYWSRVAVKNQIHFPSKLKSFCWFSTMWHEPLCMWTVICITLFFFLLCNVVWAFSMTSYCMCSCFCCMNALCEIIKMHYIRASIPCYIV